MGDIYVLMIAALAVLALIDLVVGVSNDAVNFLNSAIGSKAIPLKRILIIASFGVAFGAFTSSGMMEVARKGIFNPGEFYFNEIMIIFMAVMITDVLLLDVFNSLGMPTSTTVSIVFELLGAAVAMAFIKISANASESISDLGTYINSEKAILIISGILLSVFIAFTVGAIVQYISRLIYSFHHQRASATVHALFGGLAITAITYFIFIKGMKGTDFYANAKGVIEGNTIPILVASFAFWSILGFIIVRFTKINLLKIVIGIGTFSLAMAFAGNDLVNFVGAPIAALNSYQEWSASGIPANEFSMEVLAKKVPSNTFLLFLAGIIMVVTIWFSKKAKEVIATGINLSRQGEGYERFQANMMSRFVVRAAIVTNQGITMILPKKTQKWIDSKFQKPVVELPRDKTYELPAFDTVRASVNIFVAAILISIGTSLKLPLSTTYVTFMVAMGTSLADRAWGRESAVYRVAGVFNVIGGWFLTAMSAFIVAAILAYLMYLGGIVAVAILLILVFVLLGRSYVKFKKRATSNKERRFMERAELITINQVIEESADHVSGVVRRVNKLYTSVVKDLVRNDRSKLGKTKKHVKKLKEEVNELREDVFYFIKSLDSSSINASRFYIQLLGYLQDVTQSVEYISQTSYDHVNNNHKSLKISQIKELSKISSHMESWLGKIELDFAERSFANIPDILDDRLNLLNRVSESLEHQIGLIRTEETSPKNTNLYIGILLETKDLIAGLLSVLQVYDEFQVEKLKKD